MAHTYDSKSEQRDREHNEDRGWAGVLHLADGTAVEAAIVADGVGGQPYGEEVAQATVDAFREAVRGATIADLRDEARCEIWGERWGRQLENRVQSAYPGGFSTLCAAIWTGQEAVAFSVGDSPMFLVTKGTVERLFEAHTQAEEQLRNGVPEEEIAPAAYSRLVRAVGRRHPAGRPLADFRWMALREPGWLLLGSDGVFNHIGGSELRRAVETAQAGGAAEIVREVLSISLANGRRKGGRLDNATLSLLGIHQKAPTGLPLLKQIAAGSFRRRKSCLGRGALYAALAASLMVLGVLVAKKARHGEPETPPSAPVVPEAPAQPGQTEEGGAGATEDIVQRFRFELVKSDTESFILKGRKTFELELDGHPWRMLGALDNEDREIYEFGASSGIRRICVDGDWYAFEKRDPPNEWGVSILTMRYEPPLLLPLPTTEPPAPEPPTPETTPTPPPVTPATPAGQATNAAVPGRAGTHAVAPSALPKPESKPSAPTVQPPAGSKPAPSVPPSPADSGTKAVSDPTNAAAESSPSAASGNDPAPAGDEPENTPGDGAEVSVDDGISPEDTGDGMPDSAPSPKVQAGSRNGNATLDRNPMRGPPSSNSRAPISDRNRKDAGTTK